MEIWILCKVIDNYGDAGFCIRLARLLAKSGKQVTLLHDNPAVVQALSPETLETDWRRVDARSKDFDNDLSPPDLILEPFGTSSEQTEARFDSAIKSRYPYKPWLLIDYLSAESWVEDFHLQAQLNPQSGHRSTLFYPGFTSLTGGLIHADSKPKVEMRTPDCKALRFFAFYYPGAPIAELAAWVKQKNPSSAHRIGLSSPPPPALMLEPFIHRYPFVAQIEFDDLLAQHDVLFVRGEDSFVRAQLAGKAFVWQIYPTSDMAHVEKLEAFFTLYGEALDQPIRERLWRLWQVWNGLRDPEEMTAALDALSEDWPALQRHSLAWRQRLINGPELVSEILTWYDKQSY